MAVQRSGHVNIIFHWVGMIILKALGWKAEGERPPVPKVVVVVAPHTSYWDYPLALFFSWHYWVSGVWFGKSEIFNWPILGRLFPITGGIPVRRDHHQGLVQQIVNAFNERDNILFALTPEGTRKKVTHWKSGFYRIALEANVPISLGFIDYKRKALGFGPMFDPTGDRAKDLEFIRSFYETVTPRHPDRVGPIRFHDDDMTKREG